MLYALSTQFITRPYEILSTQGSLDLAGRHECWYLSIRKRWDVFIQDLAKLFDHMIESEVVLRDHLGQPIYSFASGRPMTDTVVTVEPSSLLEEFQEKWQIKVYGKVSLRKITGKHLSIC